MDIESKWLIYYENLFLDFVILCYVPNSLHKSICMVNWDLILPYSFTPDPWTSLYFDCFLFQWSEITPVQRRCIFTCHTPLLTQEAVWCPSSHRSRPFQNRATSHTLPDDCMQVSNSLAQFTHGKIVQVAFHYGSGWPLRRVNRWGGWACQR